MIFAVDIDWASLLEAAYISAAFGIGVLLVAGVAVLASLQAQDRAKAHQGGAMALHVLTGVCVLAIVAAVLLGIAVMINK
ncbi:MAG TPA: hypothetical protein VH834_10070 [Solirubrobacteraceae bacterium]|jgi:hypothetical protein